MNTEQPTPPAVVLSTALLGGTTGENMATKQVIRLFDSQWVNVVNHDKCYEGYSVEDAVAMAVKLTEALMAKNYRDGIWPTVETDA